MTPKRIESALREITKLRAAAAEAALRCIMSPAADNEFSARAARRNLQDAQARLMALEIQRVKEK